MYLVFEQMLCSDTYGAVKCNGHNTGMLFEKQSGCAGVYFVGVLSLSLLSPLACPCGVALCKDSARQVSANNSNTNENY